MSIASKQSIKNPLFQQMFISKSEDNKPHVLKAASPVSKFKCHGRQRRM